MGRTIDDYIKRLESMRTCLGVYPFKLTEKAPLIQIHARLLNTTLGEDCPNDVRALHYSLIALCEACIAYEDALVVSMDKCKADGETALYDLLSGLETVFREEIVE